MVPILPLYLLFLTLGLSLACIFTLFFPDVFYLIPALTTYGKTALHVKDQILLIRIVSVPKRWFSHFYILAVFSIGGWLLLCSAISYKMINPSDEFIHTLQAMTLLKAHISWTTSITALSLLFLHAVRRCFESLFVSVYSDTTMNIGHYAMGLIHYFILPITISCETKGIASNNDSFSFNLLAINKYQWMGIVLFLYCNWEQHKIAEFLSHLRKCPDGLISNYAHGICYGGWFDLVSCPHFLFEIGIYISLWAVLMGGYAYRYMVLFVVVNQIFAAQITHRWYRKTFKMYPKHRKSIIPFLL